MGNLPAWLGLLVFGLMALGGLVGVLIAREGKGDLPGPVEHRWIVREILWVALVCGLIGFVGTAIVILM